MKKEQNSDDPQNPALRVGAVMRSLRKHWRRHGAKYCLIMLIGAVWSAKIVGVAMLLMLTVPCSIEKINTDKRLWVLRQLYFAGIGLLNLLV